MAQILPFHDIKTYGMSERADHPDFDIRDQSTRPPLVLPHRHAYFQIQINLAGSTSQSVGAAQRPFEPGFLSFVLPYRVHHVPHPPGARFLVINFDQRFLRPELDVDPLDLEDVPLERVPEFAPFRFQEFLDFQLGAEEFAEVCVLCDKMFTENAARRFYSREILRGLLLQLIGIVCRRYEHELVPLASAQAQVTGRRDALSRVVRYLREHLGDPVSLSDAAQAAHLSPNYLAHLIKKETGKTFVDIVTERRMEKAQELLANTALRIQEIAAAVGFEDEAYFTRRFKQLNGVSPRGYRTAQNSRVSRNGATR
jgi:AraC-like DNA-binding protein